MSSSLSLADKLQNMNAIATGTKFDSFFLLSLILPPLGTVEGGVFTRITMTSMTSAWYLKLSHFEAILVSLVVLQIFMMSYLTILPLDITKLIQDGTLLATSYTSTKKRKRSIFNHFNSHNQIIEQQRLAETMFSILRRLDESDCVLRTLCELEASRHPKALKMFPYPSGVSKLLSTFKRLGKVRMKQEADILPNNVTITERKVLSDFEDAVIFGSSIFSSNPSKDLCPNPRIQGDIPKFANNFTHNGNLLCSMQYGLCPLETEQLLDYVKETSPFLL